MIRTKPAVAKPQPQRPKRNSVSHCDSENMRPVVSFNTKGYFNPNQPYDEEYLRAKQKVFEKYRNRNGEIVMLDAKQINRAAFIQKGLVPTKDCSNGNGNGNSNCSERMPLMERRNNLFKNYLIRKERRVQIDLEKFNNTPKIWAADFTSVRNSVVVRHALRPVSSQTSVNDQFNKFEVD